MLQVWTYAQASLASMKARLEGEDGAELVEYAIVIGLIAIALFAVLFAFSGQIADLFGEIGDTLDGVPSSTHAP